MEILATTVVGVCLAGVIAQVGWLIKRVGDLDRKLTRMCAYLTNELGYKDVNNVFSPVDTESTGR